MKVLVVDDNEALAGVIQGALEISGLTETIGGDDKRSYQQVI